MGKLSNYIAGQPGYFRENEEDIFPWAETGRGVWYALAVLESETIQRYGFTASKSNKAMLLDALKSLAKDDEVLLLGVWTGKYRTDLFVLDKEKAIEKLQKLA